MNTNYTAQDQQLKVLIRKLSHLANKMDIARLEVQQYQKTIEHGARQNSETDLRLYSTEYENTVNELFIYLDTLIKRQIRK